MTFLNKVIKVSLRLHVIKTDCGEGLCSTWFMLFALSFKQVSIKTRLARRNRRNNSSVLPSLQNPFKVL